MDELRVLVTGSAGFIGPHVVSDLSRDGHTVLGVDRLPTPGGVALDLVDRTATERTFRRFRPDCIVHLAALASVPACEADPVAALQDNIQATLNVARFSGATGARLVFSSSAAVYGDRAPVPTPVSTPPRPTNLYGITKLAGELLCRNHAPDSTILRFFNVYGEGCRRSYVIPDVIRKLAAHPSVLRMSGTGKEARDFVYVGDVARAVRSAVKGRFRGTYNVGTGTRTSLRELARRLARAMGQPTVGILFTGTRAGDFRVNHADISRGNCVPAWRPRTGLAEGLRRTLADG